MLPWPNYVVGVGVIIVVSMAAALAGWAALLRSSIPLAGVKDAPSVAREAQPEAENALGSR